MKHYSVEIHGTELNVVEEGDGEIALLFLHYWGGTSRTYQPVIRRLSDSFRCIAFDQRGWGKSGSQGDVSLASYAADTALLIEKLELKNYLLVGHSMGGKVSQLVASKNPNGLLGLALIAPAPPSALDAPEEQRQAMLASYQTRDGVGTALSILSSKPLSDEFREQVIDDTLSGTPQAKAVWTTSGMTQDISAAARLISAPVTVIVGSEDVVEPEARLRQEVPKGMPQATFDVLPGLGHLAPLEGPDLVAGAIRRFAERFAR